MYKLFGFVVFQLKPGKQTIHPMAFEFPRRRPEHLFFPTVHIHDGTVHELAEFDHVLYCQRMHQERLTGWEESPMTLGQVTYTGVEDAFFNKQNEGIKRSQGLLSADHHLYRLKLEGMLLNQDHQV